MACISGQPSFFRIRFPVVETQRQCVGLRDSRLTSFRLTAIQSFKTSSFSLESRFCRRKCTLYALVRRASVCGTGTRAVSPRAMFTGIVEELGKVKHLKFPTNTNTSKSEAEGVEMMVQAEAVLEDLKLGDSIAVNGTCLTVTSFDTNEKVFKVGISPETLNKTSLGELGSGSFVNLERALQPNSRMGGHFVQGHVDGTGEIVSMEPDGDSLWVKVKTHPSILKYIVPKGFIAVDGTSLTVVEVFDAECCFNFMLVSYTQQKVVIPQKKVGSTVNLEVDILGKYVEKFLAGYKDPMSSDQKQ
eukprot:TRINITY_DN25264_c0_g1_i1.p1 TRINITY_DN25264_c0_g1~~TRINITY_DN25264_c0_g1_i1.p1  ORF type:complete len:331 (-),score=38.53 TRINITY_DN25264_c0_g1_i1:323-1228(-)